MSKIPFRAENISALEKFLTKHMMAGEPAAAEVRDYIRNRGRADIIRSIATSGGQAPSSASQAMLEAADDARKASGVKALQSGADPDYLTKAMGVWQHLRDRKMP